MPKGASRTSQKYEVSIILPCLDEEQTIGILRHEVIGFGGLLNLKQFNANTEA